MADTADNAPKSPWQGWVNLVIGTGLLIRYGMPALGLIRVMLANQITPRGMLIGNSFIALNLILALMTIATGIGQVGFRSWAPGLNAVTGGAVLMNAGFRLGMYGPETWLSTQTLTLYGPDVLLILWWLFCLRRGPWPVALIGAAASFGANYAISRWLGQTRF